MAEATITDLSEPTFDDSIGQFVAVSIVGLEIYGFTWTECADRLSGANDVALDHIVHCPDDDPFAPDWLALAEWEPMTASEQDRDSAGYP